LAGGYEDVDSHACGFRGSCEVKVQVVVDLALCCKTACLSTSCAECGKEELRGWFESWEGGRPGGGVCVYDGIEARVWV